mmetsp:Transcript_47468/g.154062  ORF Transcript_47468/g.154062 Transcript_47468/m.154062 type:complete len:242 (-) Transcript_47468:444-1169(-)
MGGRGAGTGGGPEGAGPSSQPHAAASVLWPHLPPAAEARPHCGGRPQHPPPPLPPAPAVPARCHPVRKRGAPLRVWGPWEDPGRPRWGAAAAAAAARGGPRLDVSVEDVILVAVAEALEELLHVALDLSRREAVPRVGQPGQVVVAVLHHHVDGALAVVVVGRIGGHNLVQANDVLVVEHLEDLDLADGRDREALLLVVHPHPLERHNLTRLARARLVHLAVRPLPNLLHLLVQLDAARGP